MLRARAMRFLRRVRHDHLVEEAALGGDEGIGEALLVVLDAGLDLLGFRQFRAVEDFGGTLRSHDRDFGGGPGIVHVAAEVLRRHDHIGAAIGLAGDDGDLRNRRLGIGEEQLGAVLDEAAIFLRGAGQEARARPPASRWGC
jgi:hypothetical protein